MRFVKKTSSSSYIVITVAVVVVVVIVVVVIIIIINCVMFLLQVKLSRFWVIHLYYMIMPIVFIQFLSVMQFLLPCDSGEKVSMGITMYLSMLVYLLMVYEMLPTTKTIPLVVVYITLTLISVSLAQVTNFPYLHAKIQLLIIILKVFLYLWPKCN